MNLLVVQLTGSEVITSRFFKDRTSIRFLDGTRQELDAEAGLAAIIAGLKPVNPDDTKIVLALPPV